MASMTGGQASPSGAPYLAPGSDHGLLGGLTDDDHPQYQAVINASTYGVVADGATDNTTSLQLALDAAAASGGVVLLAEGTTLTGQISVASRVTLRGRGRHRSTLKAKGSLNAAVIVAAAETSERITLEGFAIDGNKANQSSSSAHGIYLSTQATSGQVSAASSFGTYDPEHLIREVLVYNCKGSGVKLIGRGENRLENVVTFNCDGYGFECISADSHYTNCTAGQSGLAGFYVYSSSGYAGTNNRFTNCNSWSSGQVTAASGDGWLFTADACRVTGCSAQGNARHGFAFGSTKDHNLSGITAESNGTGTTGQGINIASGCSNIFVSGQSVDRQGSPTQAYGVALASGVTGCTLTLTCRGNVSGDYSGTLFGNNARINQTGAFPGNYVFLDAASMSNVASTADLNNDAQWPMWRFDAASAESAAGTVIIPPGWSTFQVVALWANAGAGSGDVKWQLQRASISPAGDLSAGTTTDTAVTVTAGAQHILSETTVSASVTAPAATVPFKVRLIRQAADVADTLGNDVGLIGLRLERLT